MSLEPANLVKAPLRNRLRVDLSAPTADVWQLVGEPTRMPDYSAGLERVEAKKDAHGDYTEYTCYFKPTHPGVEGVVTRDIILWYEPERGWASRGAVSDAWGLSDDLHVMQLEPSTEGTLLTWDAYYQAQDLAAMRAHFLEAHSDIGQNLLKRFGGRLVHCYMVE